MRTKHLINLIADVQVEKFYASSAAHLCASSNDHAEYLEIAGIAAQLECLAKHLNNFIQVQNRSFLIDPDGAEILADKLNKKGLAFKIPAGDSIRTLLIQLHNADLTCVQQCAAEFVYKMIHKGYDLALTPDELQAVNSCLVLLEDKLDLS